MQEPTLGNWIGRHKRIVALVVVAFGLLSTWTTWTAWLPRGAIKMLAGGAGSAGAGDDFSYDRVASVLDLRCTECHGAHMQMKGVRLDAPHYVKAYAPYIYQQVVVTQRMPQNNRTGMTPAERDLIQRWFASGAPTD